MKTTATETKAVETITVSKDPIPGAIRCSCCNGPLLAKKRGSSLRHCFLCAHVVRFVRTAT